MKNIDKYVEEKAKELYDKIFLAETIDDGGDTLELKYFIHTIVDETLSQERKRVQKILKKYEGTIREMG